MVVQGGNRLLQQQDGLHQGGHRQVEPLQRDCRRPQQVGQGLGPGQGRAAEQSSVETADKDSGGTEVLSIGPPVVLMPLQRPGGMVGAVLGELRVTVASDAEAYDRSTMEERRQLWNETDGDQCVCGTWHQYGILEHKSRLKHKSDTRTKTLTLTLTGDKKTGGHSFD